MQLEARTTQRLEQRLLPQMLQSIEVLQLATVELAQLVAQQLETNEVLESMAAIEPIAVADAEQAAASTGDAEWDGAGVRTTSDDIDGHRAMLENQPARGDAVLTTVQEQSAFRDLPRALSDAVQLLAERLDERGWLTTGLDVIAQETGAALEVLRLALGELQTMEPRGLGAGSGVEAMLLQVVGDPDFDQIEQLLTQHLEPLARNKLPEVARAMHIEIEDLVALLRKVRGLTPAPARELRAECEPRIAPDVFAWIEGDEVVVALAEDGVPQLAINQDYEQMARDRDTARDVREHLRGRLRAANDLIFAIAHRQSTLLAVATVVMRHQREFLRAGRSALRPLRMADVAAELGLHPSTISRAIAGKYVGTTLGTTALRDFCDGGSADGSGETGHARSAVAQSIADFVRAEDKTRPLSDDALVDHLRERGIQVARRTVTKLRQAMGIESSYRRRQHGRGTRSEGKD